MKVSRNQLKEFHKKLCRELGIAPAQVFFDNQLQFLGLYDSRHEVITINLKKIREYNRFPQSTIAHETWHHYQRQKGWLSWDKWKGKDKAKMKKKLPWHKRPWEIGAIRYALKTMRRKDLKF